MLAELADETVGALTGAGRDEFPGVRALELVTLGRLALLGSDASHVMAAADTAAAYLTVTETVPGQVRPGWQGALAGWAEGVDGGQRVAEAVARSAQERTSRLEKATGNRRRAAAAEDSVLRDGIELAERCRLAKEALDGRRVPVTHKPAAAGLRRLLGKYQDSAAKVRTAQGFEGVASVAGPVLAEGQQLVDRIAQERAAADHVKRDQADQAAQDRQTTKEGRRQAKDQERKHHATVKAEEKAQAQQVRAHDLSTLREVRDSARRLEALYVRPVTRRGENPLLTLAAESVDGHPLLAYREDQAEESRFWRGAAILARSTGTWVVSGTNPPLTFGGSQRHCAALAAWGPGTRAVLAPILGRLHAVEDHLEAVTGTKPRAKRPAVAHHEPLSSLPADTGLPVPRLPVR